MGFVRWVVGCEEGGEKGRGRPGAQKGRPARGRHGRIVQGGRPPPPPPLSSLSPHRVPDLHGDEAVVDDDLLGQEVGADGGLVLAAELFLHKLVHERRFANAERFSVLRDRAARWCGAVFFLAGEGGCSCERGFVRVERARARLPKGREEDDASARELAPKLKQERARACRPRLQGPLCVSLSSCQNRRERRTRPLCIGDPGAQEKEPSPAVAQDDDLEQLALARDHGGAF